MNELLYKMIFKRKSFHLFDKIKEISSDEIEDIKNKFKTFKPLVDDIKVGMKIVINSETTCKRGQEYCILLYSERKDNYLANIGYIGEQIDLYLASLNIGGLWFGIGHPKEDKYGDLDFVIMMAIAKVDEFSFRKDMFKSKRKNVLEVCDDTYFKDIINVARYAPSACNTQPWIVETSKTEINVFRYKTPLKRGIMPANKVAYYNEIDMGIFLLFLELCLRHEGIKFHKDIFVDREKKDKILLAKYNIVSYHLQYYLKYCKMYL